VGGEEQGGKEALFISDCRGEGRPSEIIISGEGCVADFLEGKEEPVLIAKGGAG